MPRAGAATTTGCSNAINAPPLLSEGHTVRVALVTAPSTATVYGVVVIAMGGDATTLAPHTVHASTTTRVASGGPATVMDSALLTVPSSLTFHAAAAVSGASCSDGDDEFTTRQPHVAADPAKGPVPGGCCGSDTASTAATATYSNASSCQPAPPAGAVTDTAAARMAVGSGGRRTRSPVAVHTHSAVSTREAPRRHSAACSRGQVTATAVPFATTRCCAGAAVAHDAPAATAVARGSVSGSGDGIRAATHDRPAAASKPAGSAAVGNVATVTGGGVNESDGNSEGGRAAAAAASQPAVRAPTAMATRVAATADRLAPSRQVTAALTLVPPGARTPTASSVRFARVAVGANATDTADSPTKPTDTPTKPSPTPSRAGGGDKTNAASTVKVQVNTLRAGACATSMPGTTAASWLASAPDGHTVRLMPPPATVMAYGRVVTQTGGEVTTLMPHSVHLTATHAVASGGPSTVRSKAPAGDAGSRAPPAATGHTVAASVGATCSAGTVALSRLHWHVPAAAAKVAAASGGAITTLAATPTGSNASTTSDGGVTAVTTRAVTTVAATGGRRTRSDVATHVHSAYSASACPSRAAAADRPANRIATAEALSGVTLPSADESTSVGGTRLSSDVGSPATAGSSTARHASAVGATADRSRRCAATAAAVASPAALPAVTRLKTAHKSVSGCGATAAGHPLPFQSRCQGARATTGAG